MADLTSSQWRAWKTQLLPLLYDWFVNHKLTWPSQACRWGPRLEDHQYKTKQRIYLSEQTNPEEGEGEPPKLVVWDAELLKERVASAEVVTTWVENGRCPFIHEAKTIVHPGEVNKIRELPQHPAVVVTHTDAPELYVWNTVTQPNMTPDKDTRSWGQSIPDITLIGHQDQAQFPLATARRQPVVASGGTDKLVLLWDLTDACKSGGILGDTQLQEGGEDVERAPTRTTRLQARQKLSGHTDTVEDVVFQPGQHTRLVSVGDDKQVLFWDTASGNKPVASIKAAHGTGPDVHCVDWSGLQEHLVVTGAADGSLKVWDRRKLPSSGAAAVASEACLHMFAFHRDAIMRVEWHATAQGVLASGGEDNLVAVWSLDRATQQQQQAAAAAGGGGGNTRSSAQGRAGGGSSSVAGKESPPELLFKHVGHKGGKVIDFQWCPDDPWLMMSVSESLTSGGSDEDEEEEGGADGGYYAPKGGGTLQIWRITDMLCMPEQEALAELEAHREWILHGRQPPQLGAVHKQLGVKVEQQSGSGAAGTTAGTTAGAAAAASDSAAAGGSVQPGQQPSQADEMES